MPYPLPGQGDPIYETWVMLLNGWGYNWYRRDNQLREDDLLVRQHASHLITEAATSLQAQAVYHRQYLPEPSREQPFPPPERMATHRLIRDTRQGLLALEARIRGLSVPPTDKVWLRYRNEIGTLAELGRMDAQLIGLAKALAEAAAVLGTDSWDNPTELLGLTDSQRLIEQVLTERGRFLQVPAY